MQLNKLFSVHSQFQRSINIVSDFDNISILDSFILTPLSLKVLSRLLSGMSNQNSQSAWTITGPYGAGKSASLLFIMQLLGRKDANPLKRKLGIFAPELENQITNVLPNWPDTTSVIIPLLGSKESIALTFLRGIYKSFSNLHAEGITPEVANLKAMLDSCESGKSLNEMSLLHTFSNCLEIIKKSDHIFSNVVIVFDELGKSLEYASQNVNQNDIGILQLFAELANRSQGYFSLITVLHQAFDRYAEMLNPIQQQEWSKVQGRFENIGFLESNAEILNLLQQAINRISHKRELNSIETEIIQECDKLNLLPGDLSNKLGSQILAGCLPLHPVTSLLLSRLFRSFFAQNERSLFAFLSSQEPFGFQSFLATTTWESKSPLPLYRLSHLFDYLSSSFGSSLYSLGTGNKWAEINDALERLPSDSSVFEIDLIKCIGLLELFGDQQSTKASTDLLVYTLGVPLEAVNTSLEKLQKLGIIVYREFKQAFGFWQGSDINLAEEYTAAFSRVDRSSNLSSYINTIKQIDPFVARKHQFTTGTLRYFEPLVINIEDLNASLDLTTANVDGGLLVIVLKNGRINSHDVLHNVKDFSSKLDETTSKRILFLIPDDLEGLREAYEEVLTWLYVKNNTPALESDRIARKELALYEHMANRRLDILLSKYFDPALAYKSSNWVYQGAQILFNSSRELRATLSNIFDKVFYKSPIIPNELINHNKISGAAAGGRNSLLEKLINNHQQENFSIVGFPPEMSIYLSVIKESGLHHFENGDWKLGPDPKHDQMRIKPLWQDIKTFLEENSLKPIEVPSLYEFLHKPPYGLKEGILSIYLIIFMLHWQTQIAIYEENTYVPKLTSAVCDRLVKVPERFKIQMFPSSTAYSEILHKYTKVFSPEIDPNAISIVTAIQPLMQFINRLPKYSLLTSRISGKTKKMRDVIVSAKNPQHLLLKDLPSAFNYSFESNSGNVALLNKYFEELSYAILEFETAYEQLLYRIKGEISTALFLSADISDARKEISGRSQLISNWINDLSLKSFLLRLSDSNLSDRQWLESIGALLTNIPPRNWVDQDEITFKLQIRAYSRKFKHIEDIILEEGKLNFGFDKAVYPIRIGITDVEGNEVSSVLHVSDADQEIAENTSKEIALLLSNQSLNKKMKIISLTKLINRLISEDEEEKLNYGE